MHVHEAKVKDNDLTWKFRRLSRPCFCQLCVKVFIFLSRWIVLGRLSVAYVFIMLLQGAMKEETLIDGAFHED